MLSAHEGRRRYVVGVAAPAHLGPDAQRTSPYARSGRRPPTPRTAEGGNSKFKRGLSFGPRGKAAHAKSPAPIPLGGLGGLRRLSLGHASAKRWTTTRRRTEPKNRSSEG